MKVTEHLDRATRPLISFEIIPPLRGGDFGSLVTLIEDLVRHEPPFIDITSHAAEVVYDETQEGIIRRVKRKRPGTLGVCALIQNKYDVDAVPHVLCQGFTREETEDFLIELRYLGIDNVLAIRGDDSGYRKRLEHGRTSNVYATDLIQQAADMNRGKYLEEDLLDADASDFCIGASGYPEKHFEAPNLETDIAYVLKKQEVGADYIVTQMFFDNRFFFDFVDKCRAAGVTIPIIPGLKILRSRSQLRSIPRTFYCDLPSALVDEVMSAKKDDVADVGMEWALAQSRELLERGVPSVHYYVMSSSGLIGKLLERLDVTPKGRSTTTVPAPGQAAV